MNVRILDARYKIREVLLLLLSTYCPLLASVDGTLKCELVVCKSTVNLQHNMTFRTLKTRKGNERFSNMIVQLPNN